MGADTGPASAGPAPAADDPPVTTGSVSTVELGRFTASRVERSIEIVTGFGCAMLGAQGVAAAIGGADPANVWHPALELFVFVPLGLMIVACFAGRGVRVVAAIVAIVGVVGIGLWPFAQTPHPQDVAQQPSIFFLINVITAAAMLAFPLPWQIVWTFLVPVEWLAVRIVDRGGLPGELPAYLLEASFALVFGAVIVTLAWLFRRAAAVVDRRRAVADASYAEAVAADAAEQERLAVGALMHDSVLSALIAAARAQTARERTLAVSMASEALTRLADTEQDAEMGPDAPVALAVIALQLERAAAHLGTPIAVPRADAAAVPGPVARALALAGVQAVTNAVVHAGGAGLAASVTCTREPLSVRVEVRDSGDGFDLAAVPADRLGIRASIVARMAAVGGRAQVASGDAGTTVVLEWTEPEGQRR